MVEAGEASRQWIGSWEGREGNGSGSVSSRQSAVVGKDGSGSVSSLLVVGKLESGGSAVGRIVKGMGAVASAVGKREIEWRKR